MKKAVIFGAGQAGAMAANMLSASYCVTAYSDNNSARWGGMFNGRQMVAPAQIKELEADLVLIAVLNREAVAEIRQQLQELGVSSEKIGDIMDFRDRWDVRLAVMRLLAKDIEDRSVEGCVAELGVFRGEFAAEMNRALPDRPIHLFDTFEGFPEEDLRAEPGLDKEGAKIRDFSQTSLEVVRGVLPVPERAVFHAGRFPDTAPAEELRFALVSLDPDLYQPTYAGLQYFYPRLSEGGAVIIHDYNSTQFPGVGEAVRRFCGEQRLFATPLCDLHGSAVLRK